MSIQFCSDCNNILYPKYKNKSLVLICNKCSITVESSSYVIYTRNKDTKAEIKNKQHFINDVTLPRINKTCIKCHNNTCVSYMKRSEVKALDIYYICTSCMYEWTDTE